MLVIKKNDKLYGYIDFKNLNNTMPKNEYPMPVTDMLIDSATTNAILSFIDRHPGYNQIFITEDDVSKIAFRCPGSLGTYEQVVILFGLKNIEAIYQKVMNSIFHDMID